jgi:hypothetical protein
VLVLTLELLLRHYYTYYEKNTIHTSEKLDANDITDQPTSMSIIELFRVAITF